MIREVCKILYAFCLLGVWLCLSACGIINPPGVSTHNISDEEDDSALRGEYDSFYE